jgi:hypothetical protein
MPGKDSECSHRVAITRCPRLHPLAAVIALALAAVPFGAAHADTLPVTSWADDGSPGTLRSVAMATPSALTGSIPIPAGG